MAHTVRSNGTKVTPSRLIVLDGMNIAKDKGFSLHVLPHENASWAHT